jgi:hypothetical protein
MQSPSSTPNEIAPIPLEKMLTILRPRMRPSTYRGLKKLCIYFFLFITKIGAGHDPAPDNPD